MYPYRSGPVYGGSNYNPATGMESRDLRPLSSDDPRYWQRLPGALGGSMRPTNKLPPGFPGADSTEPVMLDGGVTGGVMRPPSSDGDAYTGPTNMPSRQPGRGQFQDPFGGMGGDRIAPPMNPFMGGGYGGGPAGTLGGFGRGPQMNPFMGGGLGGGGFGQQMNPFMGGGGFNPFMGGGFGGGFNPYQQMNPFMGGGFGGGFNPYQQMNPFMGGGGFGGGLGGGGFGGGLGGGGFGGGFNPYQQMGPSMSGDGPYQPGSLPALSSVNSTTTADMMGRRGSGSGNSFGQVRNRFMGGGGFGGF